MNRQKIRKSIIFVSFLLFPVTLYYFSPALAVEGAFQGIITGSLLLFAILFFVSLLLGRAFCGWICPGSGLQECCLIISTKRAKGGKCNWIKYFIWIPWISIIIFGIFSANGFQDTNLLYQTYHGISIVDSQGYIIYFVVVSLIAIPAILIGKRAFCHYICWMAPFMIIGRNLRNLFNLHSLSLISNKSNCINCKKCNEKCPMSLDVNAMVQNNSIENLECILCGECIDVCPQKTIKFNFNKRK